MRRIILHTICAGSAKDPLDGRLMVMLTMPGGLSLEEIDQLFQQEAGKIDDFLRNTLPWRLYNELATAMMLHRDTATYFFDKERVMRQENE